MNKINQLTNDPDFVGSQFHQILSEKPLGFVDVGARFGFDNIMEPLADLTAVLGFEPDRAECIKIKQKLLKASPWFLWRIENVALAEKSKKALIHCMVEPANNSLRPSNMDYVERYKMEPLRPLGTQPLKTSTLDQIIFNSKYQDINWGEIIKLDVQGSEYEILQGSIKTLTERTEILMIEVEFFPVYKNQKLFSDIELFLREFGFSFYGFTALHYRSGKRINKQQGVGRERLQWADAVFFKDPFCGSRKVYKQVTQRKSTILFLGAFLLGYLDFALEIALAACGNNQSMEKIKKLIQREGKNILSNPVQEIQQLSQIINNKPNDAIIEIGHFVDRRCQLGNYEDVWSPILKKRSQF